MGSEGTSPTRDMLLDTFSMLPATPVDGTLQSVLHDRLASGLGQPGYNGDRMLDTFAMLPATPVDGGLQDALHARVSQPSLAPINTPMDRVNATDAAPTFAELTQQLGARDAPVPAPSYDRPVDPRIVQTILGEAGGQGDLGEAGVAQTIMNRSQEDPNHIIDPVDVVMAPSQFSTWNALDNGGNNPGKYQPGTPAYEQAEKLFRDVRDNAYDFTGGATHYYNPNIADPNWADPNAPGTEKLYDTINIGDHAYLPRVAPGDRASMVDNPALRMSIAAGGIGPDPVRVADVPVSSGGGLDSALAYQNSVFAPRGRAEPLGAGGQYGISDMARAAQSNLDQLPAGNRLAYGDEVITPAQRAINDVMNVDMPRPRPRAVGEATMGGGDGPLMAGVDETLPLPGMIPGARPYVMPPAEEPSVWDNVVDMSGKVLEHSALGGVVKELFPDFWYGMGETVKGGATGGSSSLASVGGYDKWGDPTSPRDSLSPATHSEGGSAGLAAAVQAFIDANGNGVDDRYETVLPGGAGTGGRNALFPDMPPYRPGIDDEWRYFRGPGYADGGLVDALPPDVAPEPPPETDVSPFAGMDPRVAIIAAAEDALEGSSAEPEKAIKAFVDAFGEEALKQLATQVKSGMALSKGKPRMIEGPGGPKDDAVPALIDGQTPAALSAGEVVIPADAVAAAGEGDPRAGADKLMALSDQLSQSA